MKKRSPNETLKNNFITYALEKKSNNPYNIPMTLYEDLRWRGLIKDITGEESALQNKLDGKPFTFYWGTDPTASSLHLGHYSSLCMAKRLIFSGHKAILLFGGATGRIGDPRPTAERALISEDTVTNNIASLKSQVKTLMGTLAVEFVDNYDWIKDFTFLNFLRDIGKNIGLNYMLDKDIIRRRLETGITFAEFSYMLLQGYDFLHLYREKNCTMEVAGSDQWGNITTGVDLIKKLDGGDPVAFTMPLILDPSGHKFGKSEGNALWLDKTKTSPYEIYQYLLNTEDSKVEEYLKVFTFLPKEKIESLIAENATTPRTAQKSLAYEVVRDIHGKEEADNALAISEKLFSGDFSGLKARDIMTGLKGVPTFDYKEELNGTDLLVLSGAAKSKREAREFLAAGAVAINGESLTDGNLIIKKERAIDGRLIIIRRGKKKYFVGLV